MKENNMTSLREMLEQMPTEQLDEMLHAELHKEQIDGDSVRLILAVLEEREKDMPVVITPGVEKAWEKYQKDIAEIDRQAEHPQKIRKFALRAASIAAAVFLVVAIILPQQAGAESLWKRLTRWTSSVFEFFTPGEETVPTEYVFRTDNEGLQQVYDAVVEMGITEPVVPMWLPDGYEIASCEVVNEPGEKSVYSRFNDGDSALIFKIGVYDSEVRWQYQKDEKQVGKIEICGTEYNIMNNNSKLVAAWAEENAECFITIDCQEDVLAEILKSIHMMGGKE